MNCAPRETVWEGAELGKYQIAIRYLRILDISTIRRHE